MLREKQPRSLHLTMGSAELWDLPSARSYRPCLEMAQKSRPKYLHITFLDFDLDGQRATFRIFRDLCDRPELLGLLLECIARDLIDNLRDFRL